MPPPIPIAASPSPVPNDGRLDDQRDVFVIAGSTVNAADSSGGLRNASTARLRMSSMAAPR
jgi:hypothetical protein